MSTIPPGTAPPGAASTAPRSAPAAGGPRRGIGTAKNRKKRRMALVAIGMLFVGGAVALVLTAFEDSLVFFYSPTQVAAAEVEPGRPIRVGGLVETGSVEKAGGETRFRVTDGAATLRIVYAGALPDLFREGQGIVAQGRLGEDGLFVAREVLAKHDEKYMPPEVADALKKAGRWKEGENGAVIPVSGKGGG